MRTAPATVCLLLAAMTCAYAQGPQRPGKSKPPVDLKRNQKDPANLFWVHPQGDQGTVPCVHLSAEHAEGHRGPNVPCLHPPVQQHPGGDTTSVPCVHFNFNGSRQHPDGDTVTGPCVHVGPPHAEGDPGPVLPCAHMKAQHPGGDPGPIGPCVHPMPVLGRDDDLGLVFFTDNAEIQAEAKWCAGRLRTLGVEVGRPRKLNIFFRDPIDPNRPEGEKNKDPFWSNYNPPTHSIQVMAGRPMDACRETLQHEIGHAALGHSCVVNFNLGGMHKGGEELEPGLAMNEGWADFVGLTMQHRQEDGRVDFKGKEWEGGETNTNEPHSPNVQFRVGCVLWDLWDANHDGPDTVSMKFSDLFAVYSPSGATLANGPVINGLGEYLARLKANHPKAAGPIDQVRDFNLTKP